MKKILLFALATVFALTAIGTAVTIWGGGIQALATNIASMLFETFFAVVFGILTWKA